MTKEQLEHFAELEIFIRHVRNLAPVGQLRAEGVAASDSLEKALGKDYAKIFKTKTWKKV